MWSASRAYPGTAAGMEMLPLLLCSVQLREERLIGLIAEQNGVESKERSANNSMPEIAIRSEYDCMNRHAPQFPPPPTPNKTEWIR